MIHKQCTMFLQQLLLSVSAPAPTAAAGSMFTVHISVILYTCTLGGGTCGRLKWRFAHRLPGVRAASAPSRCGQLLQRSQTKCGQAARAPAITPSRRQGAPDAPNIQCLYITAECVNRTTTRLPTRGDLTSTNPVLRPWATGHIKYHNKEEEEEIKHGVQPGRQVSGRQPFIVAAVMENKNVLRAKKEGRWGEGGRGGCCLEKHPTPLPPSFCQWQGRRLWKQQGALFSLHAGNNKIDILHLPAAN